MEIEGSPKLGDTVDVVTAGGQTLARARRAKELGCLRMTRAELNSILFNTSGAGIGIAGTSGKSTVTGMIGWILQATGREPTIMNGAVMKNFVSDERPFASAVVGSQSIYVSEVDESDGSIALYRPAVGVLLNVSLDHKSMEELRQLFGDYLSRSRIAAVKDEFGTPDILVSNAGMIARAGQMRLSRGERSAFDLDCVPNLSLHSVQSEIP